MKKNHFTGKHGIALKLACALTAGALMLSPGVTAVSAAGSYMTFKYSEESDINKTGFTGDKVSITNGTISANDVSNTGYKLKLDKGGTTVKTLDRVITSGRVRFETAFLTTATSKASLFMRILNSEGEPMIDIAQYGSSNLNFYIDKQTSGADGAMAGRFAGLPVKKWAKAEVDIDLDATKTAGHLVFDVTVWTTDNYAGGEWTKFAQYDESIYLNSTSAPTTTGAASTKATVFDIAAIELYNAGGTNYYDDMFFEALGDDATRTLSRIELVSKPDKLEYNVGDSLNEAGLVLEGTYIYTFADGSTREEKKVISKYEIDFDSSREGKNVPVKLTAEGQSVSFTVTIKHNYILDFIEAEIVSFVNNKMVILEDDNSITLNKRQIKLPAQSETGAGLSYSLSSKNAVINDRILTVDPYEKETEFILTVTASTKNSDGDKVEFSKGVKFNVPGAKGEARKDLPFNTEDNIKLAITEMYDRGFFKDQERLSDIKNVLSNRNQLITTEELAAILVNMFEIDRTYTKTIINREDVKYDKWYTDYVVAAFQLSLETRASRIDKKIYGIGKTLTKADIAYMVSRIVAIDKTTLPEDYAAKMFE